MPLRTVRVPAELEARFAEAESRVARFFADRRDDPEHGTIEIVGERYVLVRAASLSVEFFQLVRDLYGAGREGEADDFTRNVLFDLAHSVGKSDARRLTTRMQLGDPLARLTAGPVHFSHIGWAFVEISPESRPVPDESFYLLYDHPYSFEANAWVEAQRSTPFPVCIMNAGYSSGWCEESFQVPLVSSEVLCRARGDEACRFIMGHPDRIEELVEQYMHDRPRLAGQVRGYQIPDFFARKRAEEELRRAHDELEVRVEERTAELKRAKERLEREIAVRQQVEKKLLQTAKLEAIGRLAGGIAHDFNNLMGVVIGHTSMLEHRLPDDDPLRQQLAEIRKAGEQAAALTHQLLAFSRAQNLRRELVDVNEVVRETGTMLRRLIPEDVEMRFEPGDDVGLVRADRAQISQVILNLAINGRDAMRDVGGVLTIATERVDVPASDAPTADGVGPGSWVVLTVEDTGIGMDEETAAQAFDPFFTTKAMGEGTGLGLSTVYGIVTQSGGTVSLSSEPGEGTRVRVYLPRVEAPASRTPTPPGEQPRLGGDETVLVVEDHVALRSMTVEMLRNLGYDVLAASDPTEALDIVDAHAGEVHLVLTDVVMPSMSGPDLVGRMRERRPHLRVLYMSGYADEDVLRYGVDDVELIAKPFAPADLAARLRGVLDRE